LERRHLLSLRRQADACAPGITPAHFTMDFATSVSRQNTAAARMPSRKSDAALTRSEFRALDYV
jgi:hypothetical protein